MPGKRVERLQIMLSEDELAAIDEWRFRHRMPSRSAAVRAMLNLAMKVSPDPEAGNAAEGLDGMSGVSGVTGNHRAAPERTRPDEPRRKRRILVVERERVAAAGITTLMESAGHEVVAVIHGPREWRELALADTVECAVIGDGLHPEVAVQMAEELTEQNIPFVYFNAKPHIPVPDRLKDAPAIDGESSADEFNDSLERVCA